jgi:hypothetical protein
LAVVPIVGLLRAIGLSSATQSVVSRVGLQAIAALEALLLPWNKNC